ncbi:MAG: DNA helicase [Gemmatimonadetes bacterium]|nr:DNA helicase [Gemmatimonadota bacterium]
MSPGNGFLDERRLKWGPWQAFERDVARLMIANGFSDVRVVGGAGDHGGDVLGMKGGENWVVQVKHTSSGPPPREAVQEVVSAARFYQAQRTLVAVSRPPSDALWDEVRRFGRLGVKVEILTPSMLLSLMEETPEYAPGRVGLRDYQVEAAGRLRDALVDTGRAQLVLATGLGKTVVMSETTAGLLRDGLVRNGRVLVLAHTRDLVDQLERSFWAQLPRWVCTHRLADGETPIHSDGITFATVQSAAARLDELPEYGLVLIDEAHHLGADTFQRVLRGLGPPMVAGVTATPWRGDSYDLDTALGRPVFRMGIAEGLAAGWLVEVDYRMLADNLDWEYVASVSRHHYSLSQLNRRLIIPTRDDVAARRVAETFAATHRRAGVVFCPSVEHADVFAGTLRRYGLPTESLSSELTPRERDRILNRFRRGELRFVSTVDLFNEGVDVPDVDIIVFMRATHSRRIFVQQLGRGLRLAPSKDRVVVLDFVTDLRRMAEVLDLDRSVRGASVERLSLGGRLVDFADASAGSFMREWMLDQADVVLREGDPRLEVPSFNFPLPAPPGGVQ